MRFSKIIAALFTAVGAVATTSLSDLPACGLSCMISSVKQSTCSLTNTTCLCTNEVLAETIQVCVLTSCSTKDMLTTKNITSANCGIAPRDKSTAYNTVSDTFGTISGIVVLIRLLYKSLYSREELGLDDFFILATLITGIPSSIINSHYLTRYGLAKDIWAIEFDDINSFGKFFYIMEILYFTQVFMLKLSILFFYLRIFPGKGVRSLLWGSVVVDILYGVAFVIAAIFQCQPISYFWTKWSGETTGQCISINHMAWANAAISIILDIFMLAIPLSQLRLLKLHWKKKVGVALMFCIGTFVTVISIVRLRSLVEFASSLNPTWDQWEGSLWSTIEINVGIICACMPALRVILVRIFPRVFGGTTHNKSAAYYASNSARYNRSLNKSDADRIERTLPVGVTGSPPGQLRSVAGRAEEDKGAGAGNMVGAGIVYSRSYTVKYGTDNDETSLVQMADLDRQSMADSYDQKVPSPTHQRL